MTEDRFTEKISLWLDDELNPTEVIELQAHLTDCPTCCQTYAAMQHIDKLLRTAATQMAAPMPGFSQRFETRLAQHSPAKPWQIWLTLGALLGGTILFFGAWLVIGGMALLSAGASMLDVGLYYQALAALIETVDKLRVFINLGALYLKVSLITMGQPIFWACILIALSMTWLWVRTLKNLPQRATANIQLIF